MKPGPLGARIARAVAGLLTRSPQPAAGYPGDYTGSVDIQYCPDPDGAADPGEVVWGWIPYEDDHRAGKDRPALVIGRDGTWLLVLMLTSKDKDRNDGARNRHEVWVDIGTGSWDPLRRPSEVRVDRVIRLAEEAVRREGAILDQKRFDTLAEAVREQRGT
ncbi:MAG: type II toxin-antitoxin system PemK/MazF family toxin [Geodermatophilaceae bacterium]